MNKESQPPDGNSSIKVGRFEHPVGPFGPWRILQTREVFSNQFVRVMVDGVIRPDGQQGEHVVVGIKPGVCVLAWDRILRRVHLTREFHYAVGRESIEAVSGGIEKNESPTICAVRELQEELGLVAEIMVPLTIVDPFTSIMVSPTHLFLATDLVRVPPSPESTELISEVCLPIDEAIELVRNGGITHAPTCIGLLMIAAGLIEVD